MFLLDNLLLGPGNAALFVFKELARKAQEDWLDDDSIKQELQEIYALVEAGKISSQDFEARECRLLERLEQIARAKFNNKWGGADPNAPPLLEGTVVEPEPEPQPEPQPEPELRLALDMGPPVMETPPPPPRVPLTPSMPAVATFPAMPPTPTMHAIPTMPAMAAMPAMPTGAMPPLLGGGLSIGQVVESASRALALLHLKVSAITSVSPADDGWRVTAELVERRGVPDTSDLIGVYELRLDTAGNVVRYERTRLRRRSDLGR